MTSFTLLVSFPAILDSADYALFHQISRNPLHILNPLLPLRKRTVYNLRKLTHVSLSSVLVLCAKILSYVCYTLMSIDISIFMCLFTFYFMSVYVSLYYHCVLTVIIIKKLLTYLLSYLTRLHASSFLREEFLVLASEKFT